MLFTAAEAQDSTVVYARSRLDPMFITAGACLCLMAAYHISCFFKLPLPISAVASGLFFASFVFITGISYGILNNLLAKQLSPLSELRFSIPQMALILISLFYFFYICTTSKIERANSPDSHTKVM